MTIGKRIKSARNSMGLTQKELAEKCGIAEITLRQYETDKRIPKNREITEKLAKALNVSEIYLLWGTKVENEWENMLKEKNDLKHSSAQILSTLFTKARELIFANDQSNVFTDMPEEDLLYYFWNLNDNGQKKAIEQVELLTKIPAYRANIDISKDFYFRIDNDGSLIEIAKPVENQEESAFTSEENTDNSEE